MQLVGHLFSKSFLIDQLQFNFIPRLLIELVNGRANALELSLLTASKLNHSIQELPVIDLDLECANLKVSEDLDHHSEDLGIRDHGGIVTCDVEVALVELSEATFAHLWLITSVHLCNVESLDTGNLLLCHISGKWHREVIPERKEFTTLILQIIDELRVLSILVGQSLFELENRSVNL